METYTQHVSVDQLTEILKKHFDIKDVRVHCIVDKSNWGGLLLSVYDKVPYKESVKDVFEEIFSDTPQAQLKLLRQQHNNLVLSHNEILKENIELRKRIGEIRDILEQAGINT